MGDLRTYLENHFEISEGDWEYIQTKLKELKFVKNAIITEQGRVEDSIYFVEEGILRLFYEAENRDITLNLGFPNGFISSYSSFLKGAPSDFILQTLSPCTLLQVKKADLEEIYQNTICGNALGRLFSEQQFLYHSQRETDFMTLSPTERYLNLFEKQPELIRQIPLKYLASYIGITPQALSRIRGKL